MYVVLIIVIALVLLTYFVLRLPVFGSLPQGAELQRVRALPNYKDGELKNQSYTPVKPDDVTYMMMIRALLKKNPFKRPIKTLPHVSPELDSTSGAKVTWFGHSSYLIQLDALKVLVDPVFSPSTSPFSFIGNKNYPGTDFIQAEDFPVLDVVLITHDHYDHLDYQTILKLKARVGHFITSAGVASHLLKWGIAADRITELGWGEETSIFGLRFIACPGRHFSGRGFKRNQSLWSAFVLEAPGVKLFLGGDSGYDTHFKTIGEQYGPFDLALLECGQYNYYWREIHMFPEETVQAAIDLQAKVLMPVHWGKFSLALHNWDEPIRRAVLSAAQREQKITTPLLGETVVINEKYPDEQWWLNFSEG
jgi:L-ascorbate metabolism protein UlaG (beta-lactamase superfamily)